MNDDARPRPQAAGSADRPPVRRVHHGRHLVLAASDLTTRSSSLLPGGRPRSPATPSVTPSRGREPAPQTSGIEECWVRQPRPCGWRNADVSNLRPHRRAAQRLCGHPCPHRNPHSSNARAGMPVLRTTIWPGPDVRRSATRHRRQRTTVSRDVQSRSISRRGRSSESSGFESSRRLNLSASS